MSNMLTYYHDQEKVKITFWTNDEALNCIFSAECFYSGKRQLLRADSRLSPAKAPICFQSCFHDLVEISKHHHYRPKSKYMGSEKLLFFSAARVEIKIKTKF